jgi:hypothetical protein
MKGRYMDKVDKMFATAFVTIFLVVLGIFVALGVGAYNEMSGNSCNQKAQLMNLKSYYTISTGCMLLVNDQWLPWSEVIPVERDGKIVFVPKYPYRLEVK